MHSLYSFALVALLAAVIATTSNAHTLNKRDAAPSAAAKTEDKATVGNLAATAMGTKVELPHQVAPGADAVMVDADTDGVDLSRNVRSKHTHHRKRSSSSSSSSEEPRKRKNHLGHSRQSCNPFCPRPQARALINIDDSPSLEVVNIGGRGLGDHQQNQGRMVYTDNLVSKAEIHRGRQAHHHQQQQQARALLGNIELITIGGQHAGHHRKTAK